MNRVTHVQSNDTINITTYEDQHSFTHCPSVGSIMSSYFPLNEDLQSIKSCLYFFEFFCGRDFWILLDRILHCNIGKNKLLQCIKQDIL